MQHSQTQTKLSLVTIKVSLQYTSVLNETQYSQMKSLGTFEIQGPLFINHTTLFYLDPKFNAYLDIGKIGYKLPNFLSSFMQLRID